MSCKYTEERVHSSSTSLGADAKCFSHAAADCRTLDAERFEGTDEVGLFNVPK